MGLDDDDEWLGGCRCLQRDNQAWFVISTWEGEGMGWAMSIIHTYISHVVLLDYDCDIWEGGIH